MRWQIPLALSLIAFSSSAFAAPKNKPQPAKPPAASSAKAPSVRSFNFSSNSARGRLGVFAENMTEELRGYFGAPKDAGVLVSRVAADSPGAKGGIKVGDVITQVAGQPVDDTSDVASAISGRKAGETVPVTVIRNKATVPLKLKLDADPPADNDFDFDISIDGIEDFFKSANGSGNGNTKTFQWHWSWPDNGPGNSGGSASPPAKQRFDKRLKELEKRRQELDKKLRERGGTTQT
jgi:membrane-associated protease RseP (regulator of RpoE activity)